MQKNGTFFYSKFVCYFYFCLHFFKTIVIVWKITHEKFSKKNPDRLFKIWFEKNLKFLKIFKKGQKKIKIRKNIIYKNLLKSKNAKNAGVYFHYKKTKGSVQSFPIKKGEKLCRGLFRRLLFNPRSHTEIIFRSSPTEIMGSLICLFVITKAQLKIWSKFGK